MKIAHVARCWWLSALLAFALPGMALAEADQAAPAPRSDAPGWTARHESFNARAKQGDATLLFVGDGLVQGWEESGQEAWNTFYSQRKAVNLGIRGDQAQNIVWRLDHGNVDGLKPRLAIVLCGGDAPAGTAPEEIAAGVKAVAEKLRAKLPQTKVLLTDVLPGGPNRQTAAKANELIAKLADHKGIYYQPVSFAFLAAEGALKAGLISEQGRLSAKGYQALAEWLDNEVTNYLGEQENVLRPVPLSEKLWWAAAHDKLAARVKQGHVDLVFVGDSITNGWVNEGKRTWEKYYAKRNAVNLGISCDRIQNMLWRLDNGELDGIAPKLAVVLAGANNTSRSKLEEIPLGIKALIDRLRAKVPGIKVLLLALFPRADGNGVQLSKLHGPINEQIAKFADNQTVFFLDINAKLLSPEGTVTKEIFRDLVHPSEKGYAIWAEAIEPMVAKLMGETK